MPEIAELSKQVMIEETKQGLNIELIDQNGSSMFPEASKEPYERTRRLVQRLAASLKALPYRISISGHTAASKQPGKPGYGPWELSADRANSIRKILEEEGVPTASFFMVAGRADTQPLFPDDPFVAANRRVTITLMREAPPLPAQSKALNFADLFATQQMTSALLFSARRCINRRPLLLRCNQSQLP